MTINYVLDDDGIVIGGGTILLRWGSHGTQLPITKQQIGELGWLMVKEAGAIDLEAVIDEVCKDKASLEELKMLAWNLSVLLQKRLNGES